jgi:hypothetical protein
MRLEGGTRGGDAVQAPPHQSVREETEATSVAAALNINVKTAEPRRRAIMRKPSCTSFSDFVMFVVVRRIIDV